MEKKNLRRADLITSAILLVYATGMFVMSLQLMMRTLEKNRHWYQSAGLFPLITSALLIICSIFLMKTALSAGANLKFISKSNFTNLIKSSEFRATATVIALIATYIFVLLPLKWLRYEYATFIFIFGFMTLFNHKNKKTILKGLLISIIATMLLTYGFGELAMIPLP